MLSYHKYSGAGNDFLLFEDFKGEFPLSVIPSICHRKLGVGADGVILLRSSSIADFEMVYFNADGSMGKMCGNGLRCFVHFLRDQGQIMPLYKIEVAGKVLTVKCNRSKILTVLPSAKVLFWDLPLQNQTLYVVDTGVAHAVIFAKSDVDVLTLGMALRHDEAFAPDGVNVNFVKVLSPKRLELRTYERGVENETLACGTGAAAAAFVAHELGYTGQDVQVIVRSGQVLKVQLGEEIQLTGPSAKISDGHISLSDARFFKKGSSRRQKTLG